MEPKDKMAGSHEFRLPERTGFLAQGIEWLTRMGLLDSPDVQVALTANIYAVSEQIGEVALVADTEQQQLLVYLKLKKVSTIQRLIILVARIFGRIEITKKDIEELVLERLRQVLQEYQIRVVFDENIYQRSKALAEKIMKIRTETRIRKKETPPSHKKD